MEAIYQHFFNQFTKACPDLICALYDNSHTLRFGSSALENSATYSQDEAFLAETELPGRWMLRFSGSRIEHPEEVEQLKHLAASIYHLLSLHQYIYEDKNSYQDKMSQLLNRLFTLTTSDDIAYTAMSAINMGIDLTLPRVICLFNLKSTLDHAMLSPNNLSTVITVIRNQSQISPQDLIGQINSSQIVLCKTLSSSSCSIQQICQPLLTDICVMLLDLHHISAQIGIGEQCVSISDYSTSFWDICHILRCQELLGHTKSFNYVSDLQPLIEILRIPSEQLEHFLGKKLEILDHSPQFLETVEALLENNMNINAAADMLFVHRNTVLFRVNRIKKMLCIDPLHKDNDRALLFLLYLYAKLKPLTASGSASASPSTLSLQEAFTHEQNH